MAAVRVQLLGKVVVTVDGVPAPLRNSGDRLLARLALEEGRPIAREVLAAWLWPDAPHARRLQSLREALSKLRAALGDPTAPRPLLEVDRAAVALRVAGLWCDALALRAALDEVAHHAHRRAEACGPCAARLREALPLARGPLAEGVDDPWFEAPRAALGAEVRRGWIVLGEGALRERDPEEALRCAVAALALDPWDEAAHRVALRAHASAGRRARAIAWYDDLAARLSAELGVAPDDETEELSQRIRHGEPLDAPRADRAERPAGPARSEVTAPVNTFVGREEELARALALGSAPDQRWLTVLGPGGAGKTRLAREAGRRQGPTLRDGAAFVSLQGLPDAADLPVAVARALGLSLAGVSDPAPHVGRWLAPRELLLVLDGLEDAPEAGVLAARWLEGAPDLRILATSRERVGLACESVLPLGGLPFRSGWDSPALRLWAARLRQLAPDHALDGAEAEAALRIAERVGGLPLAIELVAEQVADGVPAAEAAARLAEGGVPGLGTARRDAPAHHRSLLAVVAASWDRLGPLEPVATALAAFPGEFDAEAAAGVAGADETALSALVDRGVLSRSGQWSMHALLRAHGRSRPGAPRAAEAHARWHAQHLRRALDATHRTSIVGLLPRWDDLQRAFAWPHHDRAERAELARALLVVAQTVGLERDAVAAVRAAWPDLAPTRLAELRFELARCAWRTGEPEEALRQATASLEAADAVGALGPALRALVFRGSLHRNLGRHAEGLSDLEAAAHRATAVPGTLEAGHAAFQLGMARYDADRIAEAADLFATATAEFAAHGHRQVAVQAGQMAAICRVRLGDASAIEAAREALRAWLAAGWPGAGDPANVLAVALAELARWGEAIRACRSAERAYERLGFLPGVATVRALRAIAEAARGDRWGAVAAAQAACEVAHRVGGDRAPVEAAAAAAAALRLVGRPSPELERAVLLAPRAPAPDHRRFLGRLVPAPPEGPLPPKDGLLSLAERALAALPG